MFSMLSAIATVLLAGLGYSTLEASTRAWVGPSKATVSIDDAGIVTIDVTYKNAGKEPAVEFGDDWSDDWSATVATSSEQFDFSSDCRSDGLKGSCGEWAVSWQREKCEQKAIFQERVAFPDFEYKHTKTGLKIDKGDRNRLVLVQGCFVYKSNITFYGSVHRTAFCYFYRVGQSGSETRACPVANSAT
ncbi:hypothetical protein AB8Z38_07080 [Bradyrhizobium sp. LLZ17]|uniref:Uncharacterized protein n=1 Tax=Bradyrhizobium sp. LLZ17 TaxID=3239388 RepID=A0AB39XQQ1_9BRAD